MATVSHKIRKGKDNLISIFLKYRHGDNSTDFNTGVKIPASNWNERKKEVHSTKGILDNKANKELLKSLRDKDNSDNAKIRTLEAKIKDVANRLYLEDKEPDTATVKELVLNSAATITSTSKTLLGDFDTFVQDSKHILAYGTWKHYGVTKTHLESYLTKTKKLDLKVGEFGYKELADFKRFLTVTAKLSNSTANNHLNRLKKFLGEKFKSGEYKTLDFKEIKKHKVDHSQDYLVYLTIDELKLIKKLELEEGSRLDKVRDIFLMACSTGLRFGDVMRLSKDRIKNDSIHIVTQKNRKSIKIPLFLFAREILEKYDYTLPVLSNQKMNEYVKELAKKAEINEAVILDHYKGKSTKGKAFFKYDLISSHTGKKTFIMLNVENDTPIHILAEMTGNTIQTLKHYYRITDDIKRKHLTNVERAFMKVG